MNRQKAVANHLTSIFHQGTQGISLTSANSKIASALNILCLLRYVFTFQFLSFDVFLSVWLTDCVIRTLVASPGISFLDFPFFPVFPENSHKSLNITVTNHRMADALSHLFDVDLVWNSTNRVQYESASSDFVPINQMASGVSAISWQLSDYSSPTVLFTWNQFKTLFTGECPSVTGVWS